MNAMVNQVLFWEKELELRNGAPREMPHAKADEQAGFSLAKVQILPKKVQAIVQRWQPQPACECSSPSYD